MPEIRYDWLPRNVRIVDFEDCVIVRYKGREFPYGKGVTEEILKKDILEGGLEKKLGSK